MDDDVIRALATGDATALAAALTVIAEHRKHLDDLERRTVDAARRAGLTWSEIAAASHLRSRQAAEQRRLRLGSTLRTRDVTESRAAKRELRNGDRHAGLRIARLRATVAHTADAISIAVAESHTDLARLAQQTLHTAAEAPAGVLIDLAELAVDDLRRVPRAAAPRLTDALDALTSALTAVRTVGNRDDR